jgi:glycosyltransferase involved in cell wall biosynthesis
LKHVIHIVENCDDSYGGPSNSIPSLIRGHQLAGRSGEIYSLSWSDDDLSTMANRLGVKVTRFRCYFKRTLNISFELISNLWSIRRSRPIFHVHNLWNAVTYGVYILTRLTEIDYVVSPRGSLFPWSISQGNIRKKFAWFLFQKSMLNKANFVHVTSEDEKKALQSLGIIAPIVIVPNGMPIEDPGEILVSKNTNEIRALFLSRLHPKKGLDILFEAWKKFLINNPKAILTLVGSGEASYVSKLKHTLKELKIADSVKFIGHVDNPILISNFYKNNDIFILPSFSENFGMSILESLMFGCPVIVSKNTPWEDVVSYRCGWWVDLSADEVLKALKKFSQMDVNSRLEMRKQSLKLAANFDLTQVGKDTNLAYKKFCSY